MTMPPVTPTSSLYRQSLLAGDRSYPRHTPRSSWIYLDMDRSHSTDSFSGDTSDLGTSTTTSLSSLYPIPEKTRKMSCSSDCSACQATTFRVVFDTANELWKENPDRDQYNTFAVSEADLTRAIQHLEHKLGPHYGLNSESSTDGIIMIPPPDGQSKDLSPRITFILDSYCNIYMIRKQDLRELKLLQKTENKQYQDLMYKAHVNREAQEKKFETDMQNLVKNFDQDMDTLTKQQKQLVEKAEVTQATDMKNAARKIKTEQEKEVKIFKEQQKQELKLLKQELDLLPRDGKKEAMRKRREAKEIELTEKERLFLENQQERMDKHMKQLGDQHRQKIALLESQFLQQKQQLLRAREAAIWEMEKEQLHEKHQLAKGQLKEMFFLKRHQMLTRHQKEIEQMKRYNTAKEDEMKDRHTSEKRRLPKILRNEAKTRAQMFKQSLRLSTISTPDDDKTKIKQFEENEKKRMKAEQQRQEAKHKKQWEELVFRNETALKELEQLQAEKRKMLMEQETLKIKELDRQYESELKEWKALLVPRKQKLEEEFARQREEQEKFYGAYVTGDVDHPPYPRSSQGSVRSREDTMRSRHSTVI